MIDPEARVSALIVLREWGRIGCIGFGGPPTHIALLRELCVRRKRWLEPTEFEDAVAACNLLPGPASTQLSIFCAWRVRGRLGALIGGLAFIVPGLILILALAALFLAGTPPQWVSAAGAGAGAAVPVVAVHAALGLLPASWRRAADRNGHRDRTGNSDRDRTGNNDSADDSDGDGDGDGDESRSTTRSRRLRWIGYLIAGGVASALVGPWLVLVLLGCGAVELASRTKPGDRRQSLISPAVLLGQGTAAVAGLLAVAWVAIKVGALSYGGGFVIIPLMQADAVDHYHWMTGGQFLSAVALGQITPGPVVHTVAVVGYAAAGLPGAILAAAVAFSPSFGFILLGASQFDRLRANLRVRAFLDGAGPAAIGAILGSAVPLGRALTGPWQYALLAAAAILLFALRRGVVLTLLACAALAVLLSAAGVLVTG
ncbi:MAG TPA: chromate transporter [Pseudonocardia sp.]|uniref:chromate transporter n=1 Tax=Pseudonocardia sp. TaxID=60912 RepID=UPI002EDA7702